MKRSKRGKKNTARLRLFTSSKTTAPMSYQTAEQLVALKARVYRIYEADNEQNRAAKGGAQ